MKSRICSVGGNNSFNFLLFKSSFLIVLNMRQRIGEKLLSLQGREMLWLCKLPIHSWSGMGKTLFMWRARSRNPVERRSKINLGKKILSLQLIKLRRHNKGRSRHVSNGDAQTGWKIWETSGVSERAHNLFAWSVSSLFFAGFSDPPQCSACAFWNVHRAI